VLGSNAAAVNVSQRLLQDGILVSAIRPPTVPANSARLRITLSAAHQESQVNRLLDALGRHMRGQMTA
jgi:8-amino-7-oxononanoate synthase